MRKLEEIQRQASFRRRLAAARLSVGEWAGLVLLAAFVVFLVAAFRGNRELASFAAYAVFVAGGAFALWSLRRDLREWWRVLRGGDPW